MMDHIYYIRNPPYPNTDDMIEINIKKRMKKKDWLNPNEQLPEAGQAIEVKYLVNGNEYISHTIYRPDRELVPIWVEHEIIGWRLLIMKNV